MTQPTSEVRALREALERAHRAWYEGNCHEPGCGCWTEYALRELTALAAVPATINNHIGVAVNCNICKRTKRPVGRSAPVETSGSYCDDDCPGYRQEPLPGQLWPGESCEEFGYCYHGSGEGAGNE
jgi:hypothetical protein